jgi:hypothetical protein
MNNRLDLILLNFLRHWNGKSKLSSAFFGYFLLGNIVFYAFFGLGLVLVKNVFSWDSPALAFSQISFFLVFLLYFVVSIRILWVCASNTSYSGFVYIIRSIILAVIVFTIYALIISFIKK